MNNQKIEQLKERYLKLYEADPISKEELDKVEKSLNVILPEDFREIAKVFYGDALGGYGLYAFTKNYDSKTSYNIVDQTLNLRKGKGLPPHAKEDSALPIRYIVLCEDEVSYIFMETQDNPHKDTPIIYCAWEDVNNIIESNPFEYEPDIFPSFTDFFEWLIEKEEEMRAEEAQNP